MAPAAIGLPNPRVQLTDMGPLLTPLRYVLVGLLATVVHYAVLAALVEIGEAGAGPSAAVAAVFGAMAGYAGNRRFTFRSRAAHGQALPRFAMVAAAIALSSAAIVWAGTELFGLHYFPSQLAATALTLAVGFSFHRAWSFA